MTGAVPLPGPGFRSYLFVPGDSTRKQARALDSGADALILDLEDSVAAAARPAARVQVAAFLAEPAPMARFVRVNGLRSGETEADLAAIAPLRPDGYVLPKCEGPDDIATLAGLIAAQGGSGDPKILAIATETVRALRRLMREDWSHPALAGLCWGGEDLSADMGASRNRDGSGRYLGPFRLAREMCLLAALEAGIDAVDAVFTGLSDPAGLMQEAEEAAALGFSGKLAIHPAQIEPIHAAFRPSAAQIEHARKVLAAVASAGSGVAVLDGQMLDHPHVRQAQQVLRRAAGD
ncbi:MAG: CoA ester lyase [Pararhodobacter sp.]|nr:CoA ester lyase [Pararhodobacter sp.]